MWLLYPNKIRNLSVVGEIGTIIGPPENVLDTHPKNIWEGEKLRCEILGGSWGIAAFNISASQVKIEIKDMSNNLVEEHLIDLDIIEDYYELVEGVNKALDYFFIEYTPQDNTHYIEISFPQDRIGSIGVLRVGPFFEVCNPQWGLTETVEDLSIRKKTPGGQLYYVNQDRRRIFSGSLMLDFGVEMFPLKRLYEEFGPEPQAWLISSDYRKEYFPVFAYIAEFSINHKTVNWSVVNFKLEEVK